MVSVRRSVGPSVRRSVGLSSQPVLFSRFQVLKGDIRPAIETHEMLYQVTKKHNFLPEVSVSHSPLSVSPLHSAIWQADMALCVCVSSPALLR